MTLENKGHEMINMTENLKTAKLLKRPQSNKRRMNRDGKKEREEKGNLKKKELLN